jgi:23S rRNA G2445 N2-methylase RlmL
MARQVLAAGVLLLSGWDGQVILDPMCGIGTFLASAMIACNIPANISRFAFEARWDNELFVILPVC